MAKYVPYTAYMHPPTTRRFLVMETKTHAFVTSFDTIEEAEKAIRGLEDTYFIIDNARSRDPWQTIEDHDIPEDRNAI